VLGSRRTVTVFADVIANVQLLPETLAHPVQLLNTELVSGLAVSTTVSPFAKVVLHGTPDTTTQVKPPPSENTVPPPPPVEFSVSGYRAGWNVAVTFFAAAIVTLQVVPEKEVQPLHDLKIASGAGVAVSVTWSPLATCSVQSPVVPVVQAMPGPAIVPLPEIVVLSV
jgi:hypothetical protein